MDKQSHIKSYLTLAAALLAAAAVTSAQTASTQSAPASHAMTDSQSVREEPSALSHHAAKPDYEGAEKDLNSASQEADARGEEAMIETSHPYLLPRLFTMPTAYSLQSYELRFGGQGNLQTTLANMNTDGIKGSVSIGLGGIMELGYQLDEYYTVQDISDKILMGYFKLGLLRESQYMPAMSISASKNLRSGFHTLPTPSVASSIRYDMDEDMYEVVLSKAFQIGGNMISVHPGVQVLRDQVNSIEGQPALSAPLKTTKANPWLGLSWQTRPKTLFMYEFKLLSPTDVSQLAAGGIKTHQAMENNLGIRYYLRNWLCIDSGIRHYYDFEKHDDDMRIHANFVGVVPLATVYDRVGNYFKK